MTFIFFMNICNVVDWLGRFPRMPLVAAAAGCVRPQRGPAGYTAAPVDAACGRCYDTSRYSFCSPQRRTFLICSGKVLSVLWCLMGAHTLLPSLKDSDRVW